MFNDATVTSPALRARAGYGSGGATVNAVSSVGQIS